MKLGFTVEVVAVLADAVKAGVDALVVDTAAVDVEERALGQRMTED